MKTTFTSKTMEDAEMTEPAEGAESAAALHARLLALVRAAGAEPEGRVGVWMEHSYARAKSGAGAVRELLACPPSPGREPGALDVGGPEDDAPPTQVTDLEEEDGDPEWETRVLALAPSAAHARAARVAFDALRALRLARLAGTCPGTCRRSGTCPQHDACPQYDPRRDDARAAAGKVRRALATCCAGMPASSQGADGGVAAWLHGALLAYLPRESGALWRELACELRRASPRLARRLLPLPPLTPDPLDNVGEAVSAEAPGPWLAWLACGADRWARRLRALLHVRELPAAAPAAGPQPPAAWAAAHAAAARAALQDVIAEAGSRAVVVGGAGAGAALAAALLAGDGAGGARALVLLAPPLLAPDCLHRAELDVPLLVVAGGAGGWCRRAAACELLGGAGGARRAVVVRGADDALRLPRRARRRRRVPQHAVDAAVADEVARWAVTAAEGEPRRASRKSAAESGDERYSTLHNARGLLREVEPAVESSRPVLRGAGRRPALVSAPAPEPEPEPELDIMQLPIVFADDEPAPPAPPPPPPPKRIATAGPRPPVTVTSGHPRGGRALNYTRVIVAKRRGARAGPASVASPSPSAPSPSPAPAPARPVLLRRTVRLVRGARRDSPAPN